MLTYEIKSTHKGSVADSKIVELHICKDEWQADGRGPKVEGVIKVEDTRDNLDAMFGPEYDVGDKFELVNMVFFQTTTEDEEVE